MPDAEAVLAQIDEFHERIKAIAERHESDFKSQLRILENDLDEFNHETFIESSKDFKELDWRLHPMVFGGGGDPWREALIDLRKYSDGLDLVRHRVEKGQSKYVAPQAGEIVIDAGTPHTAYVKLREIVKAASTRLRLIDPYVDGGLFALLSNAAPNVEVEILTWQSRVPHDFVSESTRFTSEHGIPVEIRWGSEDFHDRFLLADDRLYMSGGSFKDLGKKLSFVTEVESVKDILKAELQKRWLTGTKA